MNDAPKDIYSARERERPLVEDRPRVTSDERWFRAVQEQWKTAILVAMLIALAGILLGVIYYQQRVLARARNAAQALQPVELAPQGTHNAPLTIDPEGRLVLDELGDVEPESPPPGGIAALTPHWVKQAAIHLRRGERAYEDGDWTGARLAFEEVRRILPGIERLDESIGLCHLRLKDYEKAEAVFAALVAKRAGSAPLLNNLGVAQMGRERREDAARTFGKALTADPAYGPARQNLGLLHYRSGEMTRAAEVLAEVVRHSPQNAEASLMYAVALLKLKRWSEAAGALEEAARVTPSAPVFFRLAEAKSHTGGADDAMKALQRGVDLVDASAALLWINRTEFDALRVRTDFQKLAADLTQAIR